MATTNIRATSTTAAASLRDLATGNNVSSAARVRTPTELGLFGLSKAERFNSPAKTSGDISEKEVCALFELWNSALATGDSRIVASRYTKVRGDFYATLHVYDYDMIISYMIHLNLTYKPNMYHSHPSSSRLYQISHVPILIPSWITSMPFC